MNQSKETTLVVLGIVVLALLLGWFALRAYDSSKSSFVSIAGCATIQNGTADVRDFGAKGDGSTDDTQAIQKAANCLSTALSENHTLAGTLYFPAGVYVISSGITVTQAGAAWQGLTIEGESLDISTIEQTTKGAGVFALEFGSQVPVVINRLTLRAAVADAGTAVAVSMPSASNANGSSSLLFEDSGVDAVKTGGGSNFFDDGLTGTGLTNPVIDNVDISGDQGKNSGYVGDACVSLTGGWGATISGNSGCHELTTALTITQKGGLIKGDARSFGAADEYGFVLNAGGGEVDLEGINDGADVALFNITNASSVTIANVMTLSGNRTSDSPKHYDVEISQSQNITILDNVFMANAESDLSTNSISVYLAPGDQKATISGNVFEDPGTGIDIAAGDTDVQLINNRFIATTQNIVGTAATTLLLPLECASAPCSQK